MKQMMIDNIDFHALPVQKYWSPPASWAPEKRKKEVRDRIFSNDWYGSRKMDGAFYEFIKDDNGEMELIGRSIGVGGDYLNKIDWVPQFASFFNSLPNGTVLIGECVFPKAEGSKNTTSIMGCLAEKARSRQENGDKLHYYVFDILAYKGQSYLKKQAAERFQQVHVLASMYKSEEYVDFAHYYRGAELWGELQEILAIGGEGIVMVKGNSYYEPDKRPSKTCMKVKKELSETIDCVVIGANPPTRLYTGKEIENWQYWENPLNGEKFQGSYYFDYYNGKALEPVTKTWFNNWIGSLKLGLYKDGKMTHFGDLSGITDEVKANWKDYVGRVVEVGGMEIFKDTGTNAIRHPKLISWRAVGDKNPLDCTWEQFN